MHSIGYADIVRDESKESVNYVYCAMHYTCNKFATVETSPKFKKLQRKLTSFLLSDFVWYVLTNSKYQKIGKTFRKIKSKKN